MAAPKNEEQDVNLLLLELKQEDVFILLKACKMYRSKIPIYLKAKQAETRIIDKIISALKKYLNSGGIKVP